MISTEYADLLLRVRRYCFTQVSLNLSRGGSCWGTNANWALIQIVEWLATEFVLDTKVSLKERVQQLEVLETQDLCIFTSKQSRCDLRQSVEQIAVPVLEQAQGTELADTVVYRRLKSAADHVLLFVRSSCV